MFCLKKVMGILGFSLFAHTANAELLSKDNFSIIVGGDANLGSGVHVHGGLYTGGDLRYIGANGSYGSRLDSGDLGLYVNGSIIANQRLDLMGKDYYVNGTFTGPTQNVGSKRDAAAENGATLFNEFQSISSAMSKMADTGVTVDSRDFNRIQFNLVPDTLNVINLDQMSASYLSQNNANLMFSNFTENTFLVVNYTYQDAMRFKAKNQNMPHYAYDNIVWNFIGDGELIVDQSVSTFKGSILAMDSHVDWEANDHDGQLVAQSLLWERTSQSHYYSPWDTWSNFYSAPVTPPTNGELGDVNLPKSNVLSLLLLLSFIGLIFYPIAPSAPSKSNEPKRT